VSFNLKWLADFLLFARLFCANNKKPQAVRPALK